jgi:hypothetical protein
MTPLIEGDSTVDLTWLKYAGELGAFVIMAFAGLRYLSSRDARDTAREVDERQARHTVTSDTLTRLETMASQCHTAHAAVEERAAKATEDLAGAISSTTDKAMERTDKLIEGQGQIMERLARIHRND